MMNQPQINTSSKIIEIAFSLLAISFALSYATSNIIFVCLAIFLIYISKDQLLSKIWLTGLGKVLLLFLGFHVVGLFISEEFLRALSLLQRRAPLLILPLLCLAIPVTFDRVRVLTVFIAVVFYLMMDCIITSFITTGMVQTYISLSQAIDMHPTYISYFVCLAIIAIIEISFSIKLSNTRFALLIILGIGFFVFNIFLSSRTGLVGLFPIVGFLIYQFWRRRYYVHLALTTTLIFALSVYVWQDQGFRYRIRTTFNFDPNHVGSKEGLAVRLAEWKSAFAIISKNPFGVGLGDGKRELLAEYANIGFDMGIEREFNAHNQFLEFGIEMGIPGVLVFILLLVMPAIKSISKRNVTYFIFLSISLVFFLSESLLSRQLGVMAFTMFYSLWGTQLFSFSDQRNQFHER